MRSFLVACLAIAALAAPLGAEDAVSFSVTWSGQVQDVGFRAFIRRAAEANQVTGWVANQPDGSVVALLQGPRERIAAVIAASVTGPPGARVDRLVAQDAPAEPMTGFRIDD